MRKVLDFVIVISFTYVIIPCTSGATLSKGDEMTDLEMKAHSIIRGGGKPMSFAQVQEKMKELFGIDLRITDVYALVDSMEEKGLICRAPSFVAVD